MIRHALAITILLATAAHADPEPDPDRDCFAAVMTYEMAASIIDAATDAITRGVAVAENAATLHRIAACIRLTGIRLRNYPRQTQGTNR